MSQENVETTENTAEVTAAPFNSTPFYLQVCVDIAQKEGLTDEDAITARVNELYTDATKETPETELGLEVRTRAEDLIAVAKTQGVVTPTSQFDFNALRNKTVLPAIADIIREMGNYADKLPILAAPTEEVEKEVDAAYESLILGLFAICDKHGVSMRDYSFMFKTMSDMISYLETETINEITGHRFEIMSYLFAAKNPKNGLFDSNFATYADLKKTLFKVREDNGNDNSLFFPPKQEE
jgi:hypothetical protein